MYYLIQRYKFESNSQQIAHPSTPEQSCIIWYKDTNLKAIHNSCPRSSRPTTVVLSDTKIQIWKQFTTGTPGLSPAPRCIIWYKDTNLKAIHNEIQKKYADVNVVLSDTKIQIWKQFTTRLVKLGFQPPLYYLIQRYKFESNSQHPWAQRFPEAVVLSDTKIQIWKQFTTLGFDEAFVRELYYPIQRYKFESNSQPARRGSFPRRSCIIWYKDINLKAIHNRKWGIIF